MECQESNRKEEERMSFLENINMLQWDDPMPVGIYKGKKIRSVPKRHLRMIKNIMNKSKSLSNKQRDLKSFLNRELDPFK